MISYRYKASGAGGRVIIRQQRTWNSGESFLTESHKCHSDSAGARTAAECKVTLVVLVKSGWDLEGIVGR